MTQTLAMFVDAYRALNAKKMFWVVLVISLLVVLSFALVGINEQGFKIVTWQIDNEVLNTRVIAPAFFYKTLFVSFGIGFWLAWIATILALISTAGIFPDLITSGSIDLLVAKPIGRLRLFITQYVAGLLFVTLQVTIFCVASFLVIGLRGGVWAPGLFVAIPVMVVFFSYLFSVCVFLGIVTRSTIAALLLTLLFWFGIYGIGATETMLLMFVTMQQEGVEMGPSSRVETDAPPAAPAKRDSADDDPDAESLEKGAKVPRAIGRAFFSALAEQPQADHDAQSAAPAGLPGATSGKGPPNTTVQDSEEKAEGLTKLEIAQKIAYGAKTLLPKTTETIQLLERALISLAELPETPRGQGAGRARVAQKMQETLRARSIAWVVGTSLLFEFFVLSWAACIFCRRDF